MSQNYGIEAPSAHTHAAHRKPARYLVVIDAAGSIIARLFIDTRELVAEFDAATEEVAVMTKGLTPARSGLEPEWDRALAGHSAAERAAADVYTLDV